MKKSIKASLIAILCLIVCVLFVACGTPKNKVSFYVDGKKSVEIETDGNEDVDFPSNPTVSGKYFCGWYLDNGLFTKPFTENYLLRNGVSGLLNVYAKMSPTPEVVGTGIKTFDLVKNGETEYGARVRNSVTKFSFSGEIILAEGASYVMATDSAFVNILQSTTVNLAEGDNLFYTRVFSATGESTDYVINVYRNKSYSLIFDSNGGTSVAPQIGEETYPFVCPTQPTRNGYNFVEWQLNGAPYDFATLASGNITLVAKWEMATYTITYHNVESATHSNPTTYNILSETINLADAVPNDSAWEFSGWYVDQSYTTKITQIPQGSFGNLNLYASFKGQYSIEITSINGYDFSPISVATGTPISEPTVPESYILSGYEINYYVDNACQIPYQFNLMPASDLQLYSCFDYVSSWGGFFPYLSEFKSGNISIDSENEFMAYIEYVGYTYQTESTAPKITVSYLSSNEVFDKVSELFPKCTYSFSSSIWKKQSGDKFYFYIEDVMASEATSSTSGTQVYDQLGNVAYTPYDSIRISTYDDFKLDKVTRFINGVSTSNQLLYVLEHGYKPVCVAGSSAEKMLNSAKDVLIEIVDDRMTDYQKVKAIYDWLVLNVAYDNEAVSMANWGEYDAYYMEGVFNNGKAVCDGLSKAFVLLSKLEGIPCVKVAGVYSTAPTRPTTANHAWNKVFVDGNWYVCDSTHGGGSVTISLVDYEFLSYENFMITTEQKMNLGCTDVSREELFCDAEYDFYANTYDVNGMKSDYKVSSAQDLAVLLDYFVTYYNTYQATSSYAYVCVEFTCSGGYTVSSSGDVTTAKAYMTENSNFSFALSISSSCVRLYARI